MQLVDLDNLQCSLVLDVGCGPGYYSKLLSDLGLTCIALDSSRAALKKASKFDLNLVCASATALPFRRGCFKMVVCIELLHHLEKCYYSNALKEIHGILEKGGYFISDLKNSLNPFIWTVYSSQTSSSLPLITRNVFKVRNDLAILSFRLEKTVAVSYPFRIPSLLKYFTLKLLLIAVSK
jgi:2-polyprenyl-3-methyl-5-hydroxy-6-metoxy-1,4-benzoquinol methylase